MEADESFFVVTDEASGEVKRISLPIDRLSPADEIPPQQEVRVAQVVHAVRYRLLLGGLWPPNGMTCPVDTAVTPADLASASHLIAGEEIELTAFTRSDASTE